MADNDIDLINADADELRHSAYSNFKKCFNQFLIASKSDDRDKELDLYDSLINADEDAKERFCFENKRNFLKEKLLFINFNNSKVKEGIKGKDLRTILILLPFCLQNTTCPHRIVWNVNNCKKCGKCSIGEILKIAKLHQSLNVKVAERSIFAPRFIKEIKPDLTIAVACIDELFIGILRSGSFKCYACTAFKIDDAQGYCINTSLTVEQFEEDLSQFIGLC
ncbi:DNA-binding protein [Candidatus Magnetoovum chiemensis]|nr:DNA-binding protein [Candidatus Magnetoovum chiemensis]